MLFVCSNYGIYLFTHCTKNIHFTITTIEMEFTRNFNFFHYKLSVILRYIPCIFLSADADHYDDDNYDEGSRGAPKGDGEEPLV